MRSIVEKTNGSIIGCGFRYRQTQLSLKRSADGKAESLLWLLQQDDGCKLSQSLLESEIACPARWKHAPGNQVRGGDVGVKYRGIVRVINTEWRLHNRQQHLKFQARGHARHKIRSGNGLQVSTERKTVATRTQEAGQRRASKDRVIELGQGVWADLQLRLQQRHVHPDVRKWRQCDRANDLDAVLHVRDDAGVASRESHVGYRHRDAHISTAGVGGVH